VALSATSVLVTGDTTITGDLAVTGESTLGGATTVEGALTVGADSAGFAVTAYGTAPGSYVQWAAGSNALLVEGTVAVSGDATLNGNAAIAGDASVSGAASITGATTLGSTLDVASGASVGGTLDVTGAVTVGADAAGSDVTVFGATSGMQVHWDASADALAVTGASVTVSATSTTVASPVDVTGAVTVTGATSVAGATQLTGSLTVGVDDTGFDVQFFGASTGSFVLWDEDQDSLTVVGDVSLTGTTTMTGSTTLDGAVTVTGALTLDSTLAVAGDATVGGDVTVGTSGSPQTLTVHGAAGSTLSFASGGLDVSGTLAVSMDADITGMLQLAGLLNVTGTTHLNADTSVMAPFSVGAADGTGYDVYLYGGVAGSYLFWDEDANALNVRAWDVEIVAEDSIVLTGPMTMTGNLALAGDVAVTGSTMTVANDLTLSGTATLNGATALGSTLSVTGDVTLSSELAVTGRTTLSGTVECDDTVTLKGQVDIEEVTNIEGDLNVGVSLAGHNVRFWSSDGSTLWWRGDLNVLRVEANTEFYGNVFLSGVGVDGITAATLTVDATSTFSTATTFQDDVTLQGLLDVEEVEVSTYLDVQGSFTVGVDGTGFATTLHSDISGDSLAWDDTTATLTVTGTGGVNLNANTAIVGTLGVTGDVTVAGSTTLSGGALQVTETLTVGALNAGHDVQFFGDLSGSLLWDASADLLSVTGTTTTTDLTVSGTATLSGATALSSTLSVAGTANLADTSVSGNLIVGSDANRIAFSVFGTNSSALLLEDGALAVTGDLSLSGDAALAGALAVTGAIAVTGAADLDGAVNIADTLEVGVASGGSSVTFYGSEADESLVWNGGVGRLDVGGQLVVTQFATLQSTLAVTNMLTANGGISVSAGGASIVGDLVVGADAAGHTTTLYGATAGKKVEFASDTLTVDGDLDLTGALTMTGTLTVTGDVTIDGTTFAVDAVSTFTGDVGVVGALTVSAAATLSSTLSVDGIVTVGADTAGHDVTLFGAASGSYAKWDSGLNTFEVEGTVTVSSGIQIKDGGALEVFGGDIFVTDSPRLANTVETHRVLCIIIEERGSDSPNNDGRFGICNDASCTVCNELGAV